jgi:anti-sigma regulatory factor (Ser/Thr protein kinase)
MNRTRRLHMSFEPDFGNVDLVRAAVRGICTDFFHQAESTTNIMDFCLIVSELMNNAVEHSKKQMMNVELILSRHEAVFRLVSEGAGFDPTLAVEMPDLEEDTELPEGGYGLAIIQTLADGVEYERLKNSNVVTLRKIFPEKPRKER